MFDWLSGQKVCTACRRESRGLRCVYSGLSHGEEVDRLCTSCLLSRLEPLLRGKHVIFVEPLLPDVPIP
jgi:hypothetical protein